MQTNKHKCLSTAIILVITIIGAYSQKLKENKSDFHNLEKTTQELSQIDSIKINDAFEVFPMQDTTDRDTIVNSNEFLENIIDHDAHGTVTTNLTKNTVTLLEQAVVKYEDMTIEAGKIIINHKTNIIKAFGIVNDSLGYIERPVFTQGSETSQQDSIYFNFKTKKALIWGLETEQDDIITLGDVSKRVNDSTYFVRQIRFTTSKKSDPDYYIGTNRAKLTPSKKVIIGPSLMYIRNVPTPLVLPFGYIPLAKNRSSGFIMPSYGESNDRGFFLQNGGYYLAVNDYFDLALLADIYSNGSWGFRTESSYALRYRFNGNFSFRYENLTNSLRGLDDYDKSVNFNLRWTHSQDQKASPNTRFSASVNLGSSKYYRESLNEYNSNNFLTNNLSSSISFYQKIVGTPFNYTLSGTHSQNTNTEEIIMTIPSFQLGMDRLYPFAPRSGAKTNALDNIGVTYSMAGEYRIKTNDEDFFKKQMFDGSQKGIQHSVASSTNIRVMKYLTLSPSANYKEVWSFDYISKTYTPSIPDNTVSVDTLSGFKSFREYSVGASLSTTLYGDFNVKIGKLQKIRHTMRPSISFNYRPDFEFYYKTVQSGPDPQKDIEKYSPFEAGIYGSPSRGLSSSIGLSLNNTLEAKAMAKDSTETELKKITLLNNLNMSTSYNIAADTLKWSPVSINAGTQIFNNTLSINTNATLDPYALNSDGKKVNKFNIKNGGSLFRLTSASVSMSYSFSSDNFKTDNDDVNFNSEYDQFNNPFDQQGDIFGEDLNVSNELSEEQEEQDEEKSVSLYNATIPWSVQLSHTLQYSNASRNGMISSNSLSFSGDLTLTPKWKVGISSGYDFVGKGFSYTQLRFSRDLDSWRLNFNWVPFGSRSTYYFFIGIKSGALSDVKYDKNQAPDKRLF